MKLSGALICVIKRVVRVGEKRNMFYMKQIDLNISSGDLCEDSNSSELNKQNRSFKGSSGKSSPIYCTNSLPLVLI